MSATRLYSENWMGGKSTAESREPQQILTIAEENTLTERITCFAIVGHGQKHTFTHELAVQIRSIRLWN